MVDGMHPELLYLLAQTITYLAMHLLRQSSLVISKECYYIPTIKFLSVTPEGLFSALSWPWSNVRVWKWNWFYERPVNVVGGRYIRYPPVSAWVGMYLVNSCLGMCNDQEMHWMGERMLNGGGSMEGKICSLCR